MLDSIVKDIADTIRDSIKQIDDKYVARIAQLEKQVAELKAVDIAEAVQKAVSEIPVPKDGASVTVDDVQPLIVEAVSKAVSEIPVPKDGTSVTVDDVQPLIADAVQKAVSEIPVPKDAEVDYKQVTEIVDKTLQEAVAKINIPIPKDGKDALDIEILPEIDEEKSYSRGTYAQHRGGLWRSYQRTAGLKGWECIMEGIASVSEEHDGYRTVTRKTVLSSGQESVSVFKIPAIIHQGVWTERNYEKGDCVQLSGSSWIALEDTNERPGTGSKSWICSAKKGGTGESAYDCARKAGFSGSKADWLNSLGKKSTVKVIE